MITTLTMDSGSVDIHIRRTATGVLLTAVRDGHQLGTALGAPKPINAHLRATLAGQGADRTHHIGTVLLTSAHMDQIAAAVESTPVAQAGLTAQRARLAAAVEDAHAAVTAAREAAVDGAGLDSYHTSGQADRLAAARQDAVRALADFDRAHPEIRAALLADREADRRATVAQAITR